METPHCLCYPLNPQAVKKDYNMTEEEFREFKEKVKTDQEAKQQTRDKIERKLEKRAAKKELKKNVKDSCKQQ